VRRRDLAAAAVLLAFGLFAVTQALGLRFGTVVAPGPGFFPLCLAAALCLTSLALVVNGWRTNRHGGPSYGPPKPPDARGAPAKPRHPSDAGGRRFAVIGTLAALLVYALVLEWLGFLLATFGLLVFFFMVLQRQSWLVAVGGAVATALASYVVFKVWLGVNLPGGLLRF
jgi:putative tricarboxylic transport membrane protein